MQGKGSVLASCQRQNLFQARAKPLPYMTEQVHAAPPLERAARPPFQI